MSVTKHIKRMSNQELWISVDRTAAAMPELPNAALRVLCELTLTCLVAELYGRLERSGDHDAAMSLIKAYGDGGSE